MLISLVSLYSAIHFDSSSAYSTPCIQPLWLQDPFDLPSIVTSFAGLTPLSIVFFLVISARFDANRAATSAFFSGTWLPCRLPPAFLL